MMVIMSPVPMSPVPRTVSNIPVVPRSHDDGCGVDEGRRWGHDHRHGSDEDRDR